jgi:hypothetical protein
MTAPSSTVERATLDVFGNLGQFSLDENSYLPFGNTFGGVVSVGR